MDQRERADESIENGRATKAGELEGQRVRSAHFRLELESRLDPRSRESLLQALQAYNWNISRVAWQLQCSRMTVYRKMAHFRVSRDGDKVVSGERAESARR